MESKVVSRTPALANNRNDAAIWTTVKTRMRRRLAVTRVVPLVSAGPRERSSEGRRGAKARNTAAANAKAKPVQSKLKSTVRSAARTEKRKA